MDDFFFATKPTLYVRTRKILWFQWVSCLSLGSFLEWWNHFFDSGLKLGFDGAKFKALMVGFGKGVSDLNVLLLGVDHIWARKKNWLFRDYTTQLYIFILYILELQWAIISIPITQPGFNKKYPNVFRWLDPAFCVDQTIPENCQKTRKHEKNPFTTCFFCKRWDWVFFKDIYYTPPSLTSLMENDGRQAFPFF